MTLHVCSFLPVAQAGFYNSKIVPKETVVAKMQEDPDFHSAITLKSVAKMLERITGLWIPRPREVEDKLIHLRDGDEIIICRINPGVRTSKEYENPPDDYVFHLVTFTTRG